MERAAREVTLRAADRMPKAFERAGVRVVRVSGETLQGERCVVHRFATPVR